MAKKGKWTPEDIVWPWRMDKFAGSKGTLGIVTEKLHERGYSLRQLADAKISQDVKSLAGKILCVLLNARDAGEYGKPPWIILIASDANYLHQVANLVPLGYSLTMRDASETTTSGQLLDLFYSKQPVDMFSPDPEGDRMEDLLSAGMVYWREVNATVSGLNQSGRFLQFLNYRADNNKLTLFTAPYRVISGTPAAQFEESVERSLGSVVSSYITSAPIVVLESPKRPAQVMKLGA